MFDTVFKANCKAADVRKRFIKDKEWTIKTCPLQLRLIRNGEEIYLQVKKYVKKKIPSLLRNALWKTPGIPRIGSYGRTAQSIANDYEEDLMSAAELALQMILNEPGKPDVDKLRLEINKQMRQTIREIGLVKLLREEATNRNYFVGRTMSVGYTILYNYKGKPYEEYFEHQETNEPHNSIQFFRLLSRDEWLVLELTHDKAMPFPCMWKTMKRRERRRKSKGLFSESTARKLIETFDRHLREIPGNQDFCVKAVQRALQLRKRRVRRWDEAVLRTAA